MSESDQILAAGVPITMADGSKENLRFGMWGLKLIEDRYGSLGEMQNALESAFSTDEEGSPTGKPISTVLDIMGIGLEHLEWDERQLATALDGRKISEYAEAISEALAQSLPEAETPDPKAPKKGTAKSRGRTSGTSRQLSAVEATGTSGK